MPSSFYVDCSADTPAEGRELLMDALEAMGIKSGTEKVLVYQEPPNDPEEMGHMIYFVRSLTPASNCCGCHAT